MKRKLLVGALLLICLSILVGGTMAYFTKSETAHNVITSGSIEIELLEWADEVDGTPFPETGASGVMPGTEVTKIVQVKNIGKSDAYVRILVEKTITLAESAETPEGFVPNTDLLSMDFDLTNWTEKDGFYYYNEPLKSGEVTPPLFTSVTFAVAMGNEYQNSTATVDVTVQAVQVANNGESATEAAGWPA